MSESSSIPTVLVTAATGNVGQAFVKAIYNQYRTKLNIIAGVRSINSPKMPNLRSRCSDVVKLDFDSPSLMSSALAPYPTIDYLFLIPTHASNRAEQAKELLSIAKSKGVRFIIAVSLYGCQARTGSVSSQFRDIELYVEACGIEYTILRCAPLQQNFLHLKKGFQQAIGEISLPISMGGFAPIHVDDVANAAASIFQNPEDHIQRIYSLTGPEVLTGVMIAGKASRGLNRPVRFVNSTTQQWLEYCAQMENPEWVAQGFAELYELITKGLLAFTTPDLASITCFKGTSLEEFFKENRAAFDKEPIPARKGNLSSTSAQLSSKL